MDWINLTNAGWKNARRRAASALDTSTTPPPPSALFDPVRVRTADNRCQNSKLMNATPSSGYAATASSASTG
jgi:hypothetical protein